MLRCNLVGTKATGANFCEADLYYSRPGNADLTGADFRRANLERAIMRRANLEGADLRETQGTPNLENAKLEGAKR
jgi:uncharacterized protein YjbI with pentapeptide repeats